jgi:type I restriction enzyme S subunit
MELKPGYKQTEVGVIPVDWDVIIFKYGYAESSRNGIYKPAEYQGRGTRIVNMGELFGLDFISDQDMNRVELSSSEASIAALRDGDLLFGRRSVVPSGAGKCSLVVKPSTPLTFESSIIRVRLDRKLLDPLFHYYFFSSEFGKKVVGGIISGTNIKGIRASELRELKIPRPPLPDQLEVAQALRDIDDLIGSMEYLINKKHQTKQAAMQELLTGKRRLPGFEGEWEVKRLGDIAEITMGQSPSSTNYNTHGKGMPLIQGNADIKNRETVERVFTTKITKRGFKGDILMSVRAPVGEVSRATLDVCLGRGVCAIRFPNNFLYHYLIFLEPTWAKHSKGSTFDSVNSADLKAVDIHLPDESLEQIAIAECLALMDAELATLEMRLTKAHALKQGMMQQLLTGKIRLR